MFSCSLKAKLILFTRNEAYYTKPNHVEFVGRRTYNTREVD